MQKVCKLTASCESQFSTAYSNLRSYQTLVTFKIKSLAVKKSRHMYEVLNTKLIQLIAVHSHWRENSQMVLMALHISCVFATIKRKCLSILHKYINYNYLIHLKMPYSKKNLIFWCLESKILNIGEHLPSIACQHCSDPWNFGIFLCLISTIKQLQYITDNAPEQIKVKYLNYHTKGKETAIVF